MAQCELVTINLTDFLICLVELVALHGIYDAFVLMFIFSRLHYCVLPLHQDVYKNNCFFTCHYVARPVLPSNRVIGQHYVINVRCVIKILEYSLRLSAFPYLFVLSDVWI